MNDPKPIEDLIDDDFMASAINDEEGGVPSKSKSKLAEDILAELVHIGNLVTDVSVQFNYFVLRRCFAKI